MAAVRQQRRQLHGDQRSDSQHLHAHALRRRAYGAAHRDRPERRRVGAADIYRQHTHRRGRNHDHRDDTQPHSDDHDHDHDHRPYDDDHAISSGRAGSDDRGQEDPGPIRDPRCHCRPALCGGQLPLPVCGATQKYNQLTSVRALEASTGSQAVHASVKHLVPGRFYHYRLMVTDNTGTSSYGTDKTLKTRRVAPRRVRDHIYAY